MIDIASQRFVDPASNAILARVLGPRKALFLDRDGVINVDHGYVHEPDSTEWVPGIFEAVAGAVAEGYLPVVVTNQAGIARGYYSEEQFRAYTAWMHAEFAARGTPLLATYFCPHHPQAGIGSYARACECRKPRPGMLLQAIADWTLLPAASTLIGDKPSDIAAARAAGVPSSRLITGCMIPQWPIKAGTDPFGLHGDGTIE